MASPDPGEALDRTARQVRLPGGVPHRLAQADTKRRVGRVYTSDCGSVLYGYEGAVLTTAEVDCTGCLGTAGGRP